MRYFSAIKQKIIGQRADKFFLFKNQIIVVYLTWLFEDTDNNYFPATSSALYTGIDRFCFSDAFNGHINAFAIGLLLDLGCYIRLVGIQNDGPQFLRNSFYLLQLQYQCNFNTRHDAWILTSIAALLLEHREIKKSVLR